MSGALGIVLLLGPRGGLFLMSEVLLYTLDRHSRYARLPPRWPLGLIQPHHSRSPAPSVEGPGPQLLRGYLTNKKQPPPRTLQ